MMRCEGCGRVLSDPESIRRRRGPECATKETLRGRRVQSLRDVVDGRGPNAELAAAILRRMDAGQPLTVRQKRFRDQVTEGLLPQPGDVDYVCICGGSGHLAHCLRSQKARTAPVEA